MKKLDLSRRTFAYLVCPLLALVGVNVYADSHEAPPPPGVLEGFFCNYNEGKDRDDLNEVTSFYLKQAEKAGIEVPNGYLWTHTKGASPSEIAWLNVYDSLTEFAAANDANAASSEMAAVAVRSDNVVSCRSALAFVSPVFQRDPDGDAPEQMSLAAYACTMRSGVGFNAVASLANDIARLNEGMGDLALDGVFQIVPMTQGPDVVFMAVSEDVSGWARHINALTTTPAGQASNAHFNELLDCDLNLWRSEQVVGGSN